MKKIEVLSYGEALVDFLPNQGGKLLRDVDTFHKTSGGAPANMAIGLARLGRSVGLMGAVGQDEFGWFLRNHLEREGVDVSGVYMTDEAKTGITFVSLDANGERSFMFFRQPSADTMFKPADINVETIEHCSIFIAGSNLLVTPEVREATFTACCLAFRFPCRLAITRRASWAVSRIVTPAFCLTSGPVPSWQCSQREPTLVRRLSCVRFRFRATCFRTWG